MTRGLRLAGRVLGRPSDDLLQELTGRQRGGPAGVQGSASYLHHLETGRRALETGQLGEALFHFSQATELAPEQSWGWHGRGDALQLSGQHQGAREAYERAVELSPDQALHHGALGNALHALGLRAAAEDTWRHALTLEPGLDLALQGLERLEQGR